MAPRRKADSMAQQNEEKTSIEKSYSDAECIILKKDDFFKDISNLLQDCWAHRSTENNLYTLFNLVQTIHCSSVRAADRPTIVFASCPQTLFGTKNSNEAEGVTDHDSDTRVEDKLVLGNQYPDHVRMLIHREGERRRTRKMPATRSLVDFWEIKSLNTTQFWTDWEAKQTAANQMRAHLPQVFDQAMAGFAHNREWKCVYAMLLVGPYFTQLLWKSRPAAEYLGVIQVSPLPMPQDTFTEAQEKAKTRTASLQKRKEILKNRPLPEVIYFNEPVFNYLPSVVGNAYEIASFRNEFLYALSLPVRECFPNFKAQPTWFTFQGTKKPSSGVNQEQVDDLLEEVLRDKFSSDYDDEIKDLEDSYFKAANAPVSSDSNHSDYKPSHPPKGNVVEGPVRTRKAAQALNLLKFN